MGKKSNKIDKVIENNERSLQENEEKIEIMENSCSVFELERKERELAESHGQAGNVSSWERGISNIMLMFTKGKNWDKVLLFFVFIYAALI